MSEVSDKIDGIIKFIEEYKVEEKEFLVDYCVDCDKCIMSKEKYIWLYRDIYLCEKCSKEKMT